MLFLGHLWPPGELCLADGGISSSFHFFVFSVCSQTYFLCAHCYYFIFILCMLPSFFAHMTVALVSFC